MKKFAFILFVIIVSVSYSQESSQSNRLEYKSFSFTPFEYYTDGGVAFSGDLSFVYRKHIFSLSGTTGSEIHIFQKNDSFQQVNILYGRELMINKTIFIDTHIGLGYFSFKPDEISDKRSSTLGVPLVVKLRFKTGKRFSMGLRFQVNINSVNSTCTTGIVLQWNKK